MSGDRGDDAVPGAALLGVDAVSDAPMSESELEQRLATPSPALVEDLSHVSGDLVVLGAGGKMGPTLSRLTRAAFDAAGCDGSRVIAVSRWSDAGVRRGLDAAGVETVAADLESVDPAELPDADNVVWMLGAKFGTASHPHHAWRLNTVVPFDICRRYAAGRISAFSTGNVYPLVPVGSGGCAEDHPVGPVGEYAMSCLGRERCLEALADAYGTRVALLRLNYALDLRYGVLADLARAVRDGSPVDLTTGHVNVVWQGYANEVALRALRHAANPPFVLNVTGPETASCRALALAFGDLLQHDPVFAGEEAATALLSDATRCHDLFGYPSLPLRRLVRWQADWLGAGLPLSDKPTKYQVRDGRF